MTLSNTGNAEATGLSAEGLDDPFMFVGVDYPGVGGTCGDSLASGEVCTLVIEFFPPVADFYSENLRIEYNNGERGVVINQGLAATASQNLALLNISNAPFYDFGPVNNGETASFTLTVTNFGGGEARFPEWHGELIAFLIASIPKAEGWLVGMGR